MRAKLIIIGCFVVLSFLFNSCLNHGMKDTNVEMFPLSAVQLLEGPFYHASKVNEAYVMAHDPDRLLAPFLIDAGLTPKAEKYGNWESSGLDGHTAGHYLTSLSLIVASTGSDSARTRLEYMINELNLCQEANGNGYVGGIPGGKVMWEEIAQGKIDAGGFSLNHKWVPLYNIHKLFAGLKDAWIYTGNEQAKKILIGLSDYFVDMCKNLSDDQMQYMLTSEHGGLNEVFADVYNITKDEKYLKLAERFSQRAILDPLLAGEDHLNGLHANTQIPKVIGFQRIAELTHNKSWQDASAYFWDIVVSDRSVAIGGNSVSEHFQPSSDFSSMLESREGPETCNTYNMMRLSRMLYTQTLDLKYIDYYERAMYNHILSSQHPKHGGLVYFTSMRPQHYRVYSQPEIAFWCCVGSGIENHAKYGEMIYTHNDHSLFVNLFIPSKLSWEDRKVVLTQETSFPEEETTTLTLSMKENEKFNLNIRHPKWIEKGAMIVAVNGEEIKSNSAPGDYISILRKWKNEDVITVQFKMQPYYEQMPDKSPYYALFYGPLVLAAETGHDDLDGLLADGSRMGHVAHGKLYSRETAPVLVVDGENWQNKIKKVSADKLEFDISQLITPDSLDNLVIKPFYAIHDARYMVYWQVLKQEELEKNRLAMQKEEEARMAIEARTIDQIAPGQQQPETEHNFKSKNSEAGIHRDRHWRHASNWFSYELSDENKEAKGLLITYFGGDRNRNFDILLDGKLLATVKLDGSKGDDFFEVEYEIPITIKDSLGQKIELMFKSHENSIAGGIYGIRLIR